ncbi:MAG: family 78 glycoside hydrolase catalytic domain [Treponema sp.]|nr:family 78 glycoside hydrolase catalytic domain [Treponema sp.]
MKENLTTKYFPPQKKWAAKWIWPADCGQEPNRYYFFRRKFEMEATGEGYELCIAAETRYRLFLNGLLIGDGSPMSQPYFKYYDVRKMDGLLTKGLNCIAVIAAYTASGNDMRGGLLAELIDNAGKTVLCTDGQWKAVRANAWSDKTYFFRMNKDFPYQEFLDMRKYPAGWELGGFDDSGWKNAAVLKNETDVPPAVMPWSSLQPRDIPFMRETRCLPAGVMAEECICLENRIRGEDLSVCLSTLGRPVKYSVVRNEKNLLNGSGPAIICNSTNHMDGIFDGIYDPCIQLDFGQEVTAYLELELETQAGGYVDIGFAERLVDGFFNNAIEGNFACRFYFKNGKQYFRTFAWRGFRYVRLRFGYCFNDVKINFVRALVTTYPFEDKGSFVSADKKLNAVYKMCRYTITLCSNEYIMDTPWREQGQWLGDVSAVTLGGIYACFGDTRLPAKFIRQSGWCQKPTGFLDNMTNTLSPAWQRIIPDYSLWWAMAVWNHYMYTGEDSWIHFFYPHIVRLIQAFLPYAGENGLLNEIPYWNLMDWAPIDRRGENACLNAIFYGALRTAEKMAGLIGDHFMTDLVRDAAGRIKENFIPRFYDKEHGRIADGFHDGTHSQKTSEHGNFIPILFGLCDQKTAAEIIHNFYEAKNLNYTEAQPYFCLTVLKALAKAGRFDLALDLVRDRWGDRMAGQSSCFEEWYENGSWRDGSFRGFMRTHSHAWSAGPAEFLSANLIGIEILEPGGSKIRLNPQETDFDYKVEYPLVKGIVRVEKKDGKIKVELPDRVSIFKNIGSE